MVKYLELNFFRILTVDAKRPEKLVNNIKFFLYIIDAKKLTAHFNYVLSVLELELCMGLK